MAEPRTHPGSGGLFEGVPWVVLGNAVYMLSMAALTFFLPKFVSPEDFGLWQLFQFYALYLGYVTFGYSDGILLRLAGRPRRNMPTAELTTGFFGLAFVELVFFGAVLGITSLLGGLDGMAMFAMAVLGALFFIPRVLITFIFQASGNARLVAVTTLVERVVLLVGFALFVLLPDMTIEFLVWSDVAGKAVGLTFALWAARDMVLDLGAARLGLLGRFLADCRNGLFVVLSNLSAIGLNGGVRAIVGATFGTVVFGQLSLALQISTVLLVVINSVAAAVFPNVQRHGARHYARTFTRLFAALVRPAAMTIPFCWPLAWALTHWIPDYALAISLMVFLFPVGYFEVKTRGVTAVLMKSLRRERLMFWVNAACALAAIGAVWMLSAQTRDLHLVLLPMIVAMALRTWIMDVVVCRAIGLRPWPHVGNDLLILAAHFVLFFNPENPAALTFYVVVFVLNAWLLVSALRTIRSGAAHTPDVEPAAETTIES